MRYRLAVGPDVDRGTIQRVMDVHMQACPVWRSIHPQIDTTVSLELVDADDTRSEGDG